VVKLIRIVVIDGLPSRIGTLRLEMNDEPMKSAPPVAEAAFS
jgi:hypothetical protein